MDHIECLFNSGHLEAKMISWDIMIQLMFLRTTNIIFPMICIFFFLFRKKEKKLVKVPVSILHFFFVDTTSLRTILSYNVLEHFTTDRYTRDGACASIHRKTTQKAKTLYYQRNFTKKKIFLTCFHLFLLLICVQFCSFLLFRTVIFFYPSMYHNVNKIQDAITPATI
jgi:hypothetical protein